MKPAGLRGLALGFDIDLTCRIVADENDREARLQSLRGERPGIFRYPRNHLLRRALAVDQKSLRMNELLGMIERCLNNRFSLFAD